MKGRRLRNENGPPAERTFWIVFQTHVLRCNISKRQYRQFRLSVYAAVRHRGYRRQIGSPFGSSAFRLFHDCGVDVARELVLLFGIVNTASRASGSLATSLPALSRPCHHNTDARVLDRNVQPSKMINAVLLLLMLEAAFGDLVSPSATLKIFSYPQAAGPISAGLHQCSLPSPC